MRRASGTVEAAGRDRARGAARNAGLGRTALARRRPQRSQGQREHVAKQQGPAIGVPEPEARMHENTERTRVQRLGAPSPLLKGPPWWSVKRIKRPGSEERPELPDHTR